MIIENNKMISNEITFPLWGGHISIVENIVFAFDRAESINTTAMQIFTKSNRIWQGKDLSDEIIENFKNRSLNSSIKYINVHAGYLINLASDNDEIAEKSFFSLIEELKRCQLLGIKDLVLHPGSAKNKEFKKTLNQVSNFLNKALNETENVNILIENMAGQGNAICGDFEEIAELLNLTNNKKLAVCLDTCHAFAFGYSLEALKTNIKKNLDFNIIKLFHLNNSLKELGSKVDRHAHLENGAIEKEEFEYILNDSLFLDTPKILETPNDSEQEYRGDLKIMASYYKYKIAKNSPLHVYQ